MDKTRMKLGDYWEEVVLGVLHPYGNFKKFEEEVREHFGFIGFMFKRVILPLLILYIALGFIFNLNVFGSIFISLLVFVYSNFLPDFDFLIRKTDIKGKESLWYERCFLLFFAPIFWYYVINGKAKPLFSLEKRSFHNIKSAIMWGLFLLVVGNIFWDETLKVVMLPIFGIVGFVFHLIVDKVITAERYLMGKINFSYLKRR